MAELQLVLTQNTSCTVIIITVSEQIVRGIRYQNQGGKDLINSPHLTCEKAEIILH